MDPTTMPSDSKLDPIPPHLKSLFFTQSTPPNLLSDYDVIGFDADHCIVKYNVRELMAFIIRFELDCFVEELGYPEEIKTLSGGMEPEDEVELCYNGAVFDIERGLILKLGEGKEVIRAKKGFQDLSTE